jgi:cell wall-associated NlpC family hydrolase
MTEGATKPDARRHAWRADLADEALRGLVEAPRFASGETREVVRASVAVRKRPDVRCGLETEFLFGEPLTVFDEAEGWAWVQSLSDRYVGFVPADALAGSTGKATHTVRATATFLYPEPSIKTPPVLSLPLNARLRVLATQDRFAALATGGFVMAHHIAASDRPALDFVAIAERFEGTPYLWGGRTRTGLDCSGLVQIAMQAAGLDCPRDSDMQQAELGSSIDIPAVLRDVTDAQAAPEGLARGDLIFWPGHVGIMTDEFTLLHANGHHMSTVIEPVLDAAARIHRQTGHVVSAVRRPKALSTLAILPTSSVANAEPPSTG